MASLLALKNRKKVIQNILRISTAMKAAASVKMRKAQIYMEEFEPYANLVNTAGHSITESVFLPLVMDKNAKTTMNILIGCDNGLCGDFFNKIKTYFAYQVKQARENEFWMLVGSKLEALCNNKQYLFAGHASLDAMKLHEIGTNVYKLALEKQVSKLVVHYFYENEIKQIVMFSQQTVLDAFTKNQTINCQADGAAFCNLDLELLSPDYAIFFLSSKLYQIMLQSMHAENKQRIYAMSQAKTNAESMEKLVNRLYNRARQEKITLALNEIIAGV